MSRITYSTDPCYVCGKRISCNGAARTSHYRKHVREGRMIETKDYEGYNKFIAVRKADEATRPRVPAPETDA